MTMLGQKHWAIAEGYIPSQSSFSDPALISHETACILNAGDVAAHVRITVFFADREPVGPYLVTVEPRRTLHLRFNDLDRPAPIPRDTPYSGIRIRCAHCRAAHAVGFPACRGEFALHRRLCRGFAALKHDPEKWKPVFGKIMLKQ
jgi:hypothetical protein